MANTIADKLTYLSGTKEAIKEAIIAKGVSVSDTDTFRSYANKIEAIQAGGGTVNIPDGTKFAYSTFTTVPDSIIPYLEQQTDMYKMFSNCEKLQTVQLFDTSNVNDMSYMFSYCYSLQTIPLLNVSNVTNMNHMFYYCKKLQTVPLFDTSNVNDMVGMFLNCTSLTTVPQFDTANVINMNYMFSYCQSLTSVPLLNVSNVTDMGYMFNYCDSLTNLGGLTGLKMNLYLDNSPKLTVDSVMNVINNAADMTSEPKTLTLHQDVFNKLTQEQITTATSKGWNIAAA